MIPEALAAIIRDKANETTDHRLLIHGFLRNRTPGRGGHDFCDDLSLEWCAAIPVRSVVAAPQADLPGPLRLFRARQ